MANETVMTIIGNLTADPELRTTGSGANVVNFTIASTPSTYNKQTGQWEDGQALFLRCSAWRELADHIAASLSKGMRVIASGTLSQHSYQAQDGTNRTVMQLTVTEIGPSLRYATAAVARQPKANGGYSGGSSFGGGFNGGGGSATGSAPAQAAALAASQEQATDPWATDTGNFSPEPEPEF